MAQSSSVARRDRRPDAARARVRVVDAQLDAGRVQRAPARAAGSAGAASACTSSVSAALQTPGRWILALSDDRLGGVEVGVAST